MLVEIGLWRVDGKPVRLLPGGTPKLTRSSASSRSPRQAGTQPRPWPGPSYPTRKRQALSPIR